jgi:hypothetical protein
MSDGQSVMKVVSEGHRYRGGKLLSNVKELAPEIKSETIYDTQRSTTVFVRKRSQRSTIGAQKAFKLKIHRLHR